MAGLRSHFLDKYTSSLFLVLTAWIVTLARPDDGKQMPLKGPETAAAFTENGNVVKNVAIIGIFVFRYGTQPLVLIDPRLGSVRCRKCFFP